MFSQQPNRERERERERGTLNRDPQCEKRASRLGWRSEALTNSITRLLSSPLMPVKSRRNPNHSSMHPSTF